MTRSSQLSGGREVLQVSKIAAVSMIMFVVLVAGFLTLPVMSAKNPSLFNASVVVTRSKLSNRGEWTLVFLYIENRAPFGVLGGRGVREGLGNILKVDSIDVQLTLNGVPVAGFPRTDQLTVDITFEPPTVTRTITAPFGIYAGRWSPIVLPGERVAVYYATWGVGCGEGAGAYEYTFTAHATFQGSSVVLPAVSGKFKVEKTFPPCVAGLVATSVTGVPVVGATISLSDLTTGKLVATTSTDSFGNYYFDATVGLTVGDSYQVQVTALPAGFTTVSPSSTSDSFTWTGSTVMVEPFPFWAS
jgi:hypothetical protein